MDLDLDEENAPQQAKPLSKVARYCAPEVLRGQAATHASDVYTFGPLLYELMSGHAPFWEVPDEIAVQMLQEGLRPSLDSKWHPIVQNLIQRCWAQEPNQRPLHNEVIRDLQFIAGTCTTSLCIVLISSFSQSERARAMVCQEA